MVSKLFQNIVYDIKEVIGQDFGIADQFGVVLASTVHEEKGKIMRECVDFLNTDRTYQDFHGIAMKRIKVQGNEEYVIYIRSKNKNNKKYLGLISISIENIKIYYDEKYDRNSFVKNVVLGNVLPGDIPIRAKQLQVKNDVKRICYLIRTQKTRELFAYNVIQSLFPNSSKDFVVLLDDENTLLIKELREKDTQEEIYKKARIIIDTLNTELMIKASIGIGTIASSLKGIARSYKEAQTALQIGSIFESEKRIVDYAHLGIGRLIYQLPVTLCRLFLQEIFKEGTFESIDPETMLTIQKFFENNLNVSETSRKLFIHRNTLVYRLEKIEKITGMDLRKFDDAIYFKVAMMVKRYLDASGKRIEFLRRVKR